MSEARRSFEDIDCAVISLKRTPERLAAFLDFNRPTGIDFQVLEAVDGSQLGDAELMPPHLFAPGTIGYTRGAIGNALSHRKLWDQAIARRRLTFIFEDDAIVRHDIKESMLAVLNRLGDKWDFVTFASNTDTIVHIEYVAGTDAILHFTVPFPDEAGLRSFAAGTGPAAAYRLRNSFGTCGYVVSPGGAAKLKAAVFPLDNRLAVVPGLKRTIASLSFDIVMNAVYRSIDAYACVPPLVLSPNQKKARTI